MNKPETQSGGSLQRRVRRTDNAAYMRNFRRTNSDSYNASQAKRGRAGIGLMKCHECKLEYAKERAFEGRYIKGKLWLCQDCANAYERHAGPDATE